MGGAKIALNPAVVDQFPEAHIPMGNTAENVARRFGVSREQQDAFALASHQKAVAAWARGDFAAEVLPVKTRVFDGEVWRDLTVDRDEGPRADTSLEKLAALKPAFDPTGSVTAGNSSPLNDGAAAVILTSADKAKAVARSRAPSSARSPSPACRPRSWGSARCRRCASCSPRPASRSTRSTSIEVNEAFASQAVYCVRELGLPVDRVNVNGGAIAIGHPLGATGARQIAHRAPRARAPPGPLRRHHHVRRRRDGRGRPHRARALASLRPGPLVGKGGSATADS